MEYEEHCKVRDQIEQLVMNLCSTSAAGSSGPLPRPGLPPPQAVTAKLPPAIPTLAAVGCSSPAAPAGVVGVRPGPSFNLGMREVAVSN